MSHYFLHGLGAITLMIATALPMSAAADSAQDLKQKLANVDTLQANFQQSVTDINNKQIQQGSGIFALAHPNKFYWHLTEPDESLIVADGTDVWIYNPFAEEVTVLGLNDAIKASPIALLVNRDDETWSKYQVVANKGCYDIKPKTTDAQVTEVSVCFVDDTISRFRLADEQGNTSVFTLSEQSHVPVDGQSIFQFDMPEDVDLDDQRTSKP